MGFTKLERRLARLVQEDKADEARVYAKQLTEQGTTLDDNGYTPTEFVENIIAVHEVEKRGARGNPMGSWADKVAKPEISEEDYRRMEFMATRRLLIKAMQQHYHADRGVDMAIREGLEEVVKWLGKRPEPQEPIEYPELEKVVNTMVRHGKVKQKAVTHPGYEVDVEKRVKHAIKEAYEQAHAHSPRR